MTSNITNLSSSPETGEQAYYQPPVEQTEVSTEQQLKASKIGYIVFETQFPVHRKRDADQHWRKSHGLTIDDVYNPVVD